MSDPKMLRNAKPLPVDKFAAKYERSNNKFVIVDGHRPIPHPDNPGQAVFIPCKIQLVIKPDGGLAGRIVS